MKDTTITVESGGRSLPMAAAAKKRTNRKPFNADAGYKCSLKTPFGWAVVYDREKGGDWIDGDTRWVVAAYDKTKANIGLLDCRSEREARDTMKDARAGHADWIACFQ